MGEKIRRYDAIALKWKNSLRIKIAQFTGVYERVKQMDESGSCDLVVFPNALAEYEKQYGDAFTLEPERVRLLVGSPRASTTPSYFPGPSTTPSYSPGPLTSPSYSLGHSRNAECSNCKLLIGKLQVLEATLELYMHPEKHTIDSTALLHDL
ncbi:hypothetical protein Tco_0352106 [Tanacetum coccineum]